MNAPKKLCRMMITPSDFTVSIFSSDSRIVLASSPKANAAKAEQNPQLKQLVWVNICPTNDLCSDKKTPL